MLKNISLPKTKNKLIKEKNREAKVGEEFSARATDVADDGRAIVVHVSGRKFFVAGVWFDEKITCEVESLSARSGVAALKAVIESSPYRIDPPCNYSKMDGRTKKSSCGGCAWMFVRYDEQLAAKQKRVERIILKAALGIKSDLEAQSGQSIILQDALKQKIRPIQPSANTQKYRNRAQLKTNGEQLGFIAAKSNSIVDIQQCYVLSDPLQNTLTRLRAQLPNKSWQPAKANKFVELHIDDSVNKKAIEANQPLPFRQGNTHQNNFMRAWLNEQLENIAHSQSVIELFCGNGNFTEIIAGRGFKKIIAAEGDDQAIAQLKEKQLPGVEAFHADLFNKDALRGIIRKSAKAGVLVVDPPRAGLKHCEEILAAGADLTDIFYISCDLATFARDTEIFLTGGFEYQLVQPLDQFPHTPHIELLAHLTRKAK